MCDSSFNVKVVAVAKDAAPILPNWIAHHLYFGFDSIEIYVNRTEDCTEQVLQKISSVYPKVSYQFCDWVDQLPQDVAGHMQRIIYAKSFYEGGKAGYSHILFIDVDELWLPRNLTDGIHNLLRSLPAHGMVSFPWAIEHHGSLKDVIGRRITVANRQVVKSLVNTAMPVRAMRVHRPEPRGQVWKDMSLDPFGERFNANGETRNNLHPSKLDIAYPYVVLHRMFGTEGEYLASLVAGQIEGGFFKLNRSGYQPEVHHINDIEFPDLAYRDYCNFIRAFDEAVSVHDELESARKLWAKKAKQAVPKLLELSKHSPADFMRITRGVTHPEILRVRSRYDKQVIQ